MRRRNTVWILALTLVAVTAATFVGGGFYDVYGRWSAKRVVTRALDGFSRHAVPQDVALEVEVSDAEQVAAALRAGFEVEVVDNILWSYRSFEVAVRIANGTDLWCDVYHLPKWSLKCWPTSLPKHAV